MFRAGRAPQLHRGAGSRDLCFRRIPGGLPASSSGHRRAGILPAFLCGATSVPILRHRAATGRSGIMRFVRPSRRANRNSKLLETPPTQTKQSIALPSNRNKTTTTANSRFAFSSRATKVIPEFRALCVRRTPGGLIGTPKRLEIAATQTKQTTEVISNRDKIGAS